MKDSIFFAKGISFLYEKRNKSILKNVFSRSKSGFFDFSIFKKSKVKYLNTGKQLYYLGYEEFFNILKNKKKFFSSKIKIKNDKIYFGVSTEIKI